MIYKPERVCGHKTYWKIVLSIHHHNMHNVLFLIKIYYCMLISCWPAAHPGQCATCFIMVLLLPAKHRDVLLLWFFADYFQFYGQSMPWWLLSFHCKHLLLGIQNVIFLVHLPVRNQDSTAAGIKWRYPEPPLFLTAIILCLSAHFSMEFAAAAAVLFTSLVLWKGDLCA